MIDCFDDLGKIHARVFDDRDDCKRFYGDGYEVSSSFKEVDEVRDKNHNISDCDSHNIDYTCNDFKYSFDNMKNFYSDERLEEILRSNGLNF